MSGSLRKRRGRLFGGLTIHVERHNSHLRLVQDNAMSLASDMGEALGYEDGLTQRAVDLAHSLGAYERAYNEKQRPNPDCPDCEGWGVIPRSQGNEPCKRCGTTEADIPPHKWTEKAEVPEQTCRNPGEKMDGSNYYADGSSVSWTENVGGQSWNWNAQVGRFGMSGRAPTLTLAVECAEAARRRMKQEADR